MCKKPNDFYKISTMFKKRNPQIKEKEDLKEKVLDHVTKINTMKKKMV